MSDKKYFWLKLKRDFFKRHDIRIIEAMPNGKDYILFYLKLLCESVDHEGNLRFSEQIPYNEEMLATITNTNIDIVRCAIKIFTELEMMEILDDGTYFMNEVNRMIGFETDWAEKKRKQRDLPKLVNGSKRLNAEMMRLPDGSTRIIDEKRYGGNGMLVLDRSGGKCEMCGSSENVVIHHNNGYSNAPEDLICLFSKCHGIVHSEKNGGKCPPIVPQMSDKSIDKEIEKDKDKDKEIEKKRKKDRPLAEVLDDVPSIKNNEYLREAFLGFIEMRKKIKAPLTERALKMVVNEAYKLAYGDPTRMKVIVDQSTKNGWKDVYPLKNKEQAKESDNPFTDILREEGYL